MGLKRKQAFAAQKARLEQELKNRLSFLSGKGIESPRAGKDTIVRKLQADVRAANHRLERIAENDKRTQELKKMKADKAAAALKKQEGGKAEKPKKGPEAIKEKKPKAEKKPAPPKAPEGGQAPNPAKADA
jgi:hypothetical protein